MTTRIFRSAAGLILLATIFVCQAATAKVEKGPYLQNVQRTSVTICWESGRATPSKITYAPGHSDDIKTLDVAASEFNEITIKGLEPGTKYRYSLWQDDKVQGSGTFRTAPAQPGPFQFIAYGDSRTLHDKHTAIINMMLNYKPEFILNTGDLVADGRKQDDWDEFWKIVQPLAKDSPIYPALGNHEHHSKLYYKYFSVPDNGNEERYYALAYGNVVVLSLDSDAPDFLTTQKLWTIKMLKRTENFDYRIVYFHYPPYSTSGREPNVHIRKVYGPIFDEYGVKLVLNGHDHFYERSVDDMGITYVIAGGGGAPLYGFERNNPESKVRKSIHHFIVFDVNDEKMAARVFDIDGNIIDEFEIAAE